ncbi:MAG: hypothetical protein NWE98_10395 [Candidatus Bathyarchaeota archaeon]|nr:hypothetical protein [Candidatus Bathyarchaeota archaeon]
MISPNKLNRNTVTVAAIAIFSALYAVLRLIPLGPMIGLSATFSVSDFLAPIYGIILGPLTGGVSVVIGTFIAIAMGKPIVFMGLDFLPAFVNTVAIGFLVRRKWMPALILNVALLAIFIANPLTVWSYDVSIGSWTRPIPFFWLHIVALFVLVSPLGYKAGPWVRSLKPELLTAGVATLAFVGTMMQHLTGNILTEVVRTQIFHLTNPDAFATLIWPAAFVLYPWERLTLVVLATIVGVPLIKALKSTILPFDDKKAPPVIMSPPPPPPSP